MAKAIKKPAILVTRIRKQLLLAADGDVEAIHALRVILKKLRPFMAAADSITDQGLILDRDFTRIRRLFKAAGRLREYHLFKPCIQALFGEIPVELIGRLELGETQALTAWLSLLKRYARCLPASLTRIQRALKRTKPEAMQMAMMHILFTQASELRRATANLQTEQDLHTARKAIKQMLACQRYLQFSEWVTWTNAATSLADSIGARHDRFDAANYLEEMGMPEIMQQVIMIRKELQHSFNDEAERVLALVEMLPSA